MSTKQYYNGKLFNPQQEDEICNLYTTGYTKTELGRLFNCSGTTITDILRWHDVDNDHSQKDLSGRKYDSWEVIKFDKIMPKQHVFRWWCKCLKCDGLQSLPSGALVTHQATCKKCVRLSKKGETYLGLGSRRKGKTGKLNNLSSFIARNLRYDLTGSYGRCYVVPKGIEFLFDLEDYDRIKEYYWRVSSAGYILRTHREIKNGCTHYTEVFLHNEIAKIQKTAQIDHINRIRTDNRKCNLRRLPDGNRGYNACNITVRTDNITKITGVTWHKQHQKWNSSIQFNRTQRTIGIYHNKEDAIKARLLAEKEIFGQFAPQLHLFEKYGIEKPEIVSLQDEIDRGIYEL